MCIHQNYSLASCLCSRLIKTDMELEVLRYTNRVSSEAHKMVRCCFKSEGADSNYNRLCQKSLLRKSFTSSIEDVR